MTDIFVFGSNLAGRHGKGSAKEAVDKHGAIYGQGSGRQGNSYAILTKDRSLRSLRLDEIHHHVSDFIMYATWNQAHTFNVVAIGCGLAGYKPEEIGPMFRMVKVLKLTNVNLPDEFLPYVE